MTKSVVETTATPDRAAGRNEAGLWLFHVVLLAWLALATGGVTHRDLFLENQVKLPLLATHVPLIGFFAVMPGLVLIVHAAVLMHFGCWPAMPAPAVCRWTCRAWAA